MTCNPPFLPVPAHAQDSLSLCRLLTTLSSYLMPMCFLTITATPADTPPLSVCMALLRRACQPLFLAVSSALLHCSSSASLDSWSKITSAELRQALACPEFHAFMFQDSMVQTPLSLAHSSSVVVQQKSPTGGTSWSAFFLALRLFLLRRLVLLPSGIHQGGKS